MDRIVIQRLVEREQRNELMLGLRMEGSRVFTVHYHFLLLLIKTRSTTMCQQGRVFIFTENMQYRCECVVRVCICVWGKAWAWPC